MTLLAIALAASLVYVVGLRSNVQSLRHKLERAQQDLADARMLIRDASLQINDARQVFGADPSDWRAWADELRPPR